MALLLVATTSASKAQDNDVAAELQCLRQLQALERSFHIPQGLLTAISLAESGRAVDGDGDLVAWPWTINVNGKGFYFDTKQEAVDATRKLIDEGQRSIDIGCMQVNLRYHPNAFNSIDDAFDPAQNVAYGAQYLSSLHRLQGSWTKAVERYHSSNDVRREDYREKVLDLWNTKVRDLVMNAVLAENTDTPYHRAIRDFAAGRYSAALAKYQEIVAQQPEDRIGLLGIAMNYEALGQEPEAVRTYARYLSVEPTNENVFSKLIDKAIAKEPAAARDDLQMLLETGITRPALYAALAEVTTAAGDTATAYQYATNAARSAPSVPAYLLNAGVLADRLNQKMAAIQYYEQFLAQFARNPVLIDASIDGVRDRLNYLRARL